MSNIVCTILVLGTVEMPRGKMVGHQRYRSNLRHRFEVIGALGQGTYGKVKLATDKATGEKVSITK